MSFRIVVLISGSGSNLQSLFDAQDAGILNAEIVLTLSDRANAYGLQRALARKVSTAYVPLSLKRNMSHNVQSAIRATWEQRISDIVAAFAPDLILLSGFMRILSAQFLNRFPNKVINQHPALLPDPGSDTVRTSNGVELPVLRGAHVVAEALKRGLPMTGCTVHWVTPIIDEGSVLARAEVPILPDDNQITLHERIKNAERRLIIQVIQELARAAS